MSGVLGKNEEEVSVVLRALVKLRRCSPAQDRYPGSGNPARPPGFAGLWCRQVLVAHCGLDRAVLRVYWDGLLLTFPHKASMRRTPSLGCRQCCLCSSCDMPLLPERPWTWSHYLFPPWGKKFRIQGPRIQGQRLVNDSLLSVFM